MKKKIVLMLMLFVSIFTITGCDKGKKYYEGYKYLNFKEVLEAEEFELENKDYEETDDQAIIYLFRGQGCGFCRSFISFLNSISTEYGKYFKVVSFEVWRDQNNSDLMAKMPLVTEVEARGVPYIIIGDKVFDGYAESYNEEIKAQIMKQYKDSSYDVFEDLKKEESKFNGFSNTDIVIINVLLTIIVIVLLMIKTGNDKKEILCKLEEYTNKNNTKVTEVVKEEKQKIKHKKDSESRAK
jgi:thiol-disulfide isomerase/thioredoxin